MLLKNVYLCLLLEGKANEEVYEKDRIVVDCRDDDLPAMAQVSFGVRAGGAYSSLIQKVEDTYEAGARFGFSIAGLADIPLSKNKNGRFVLRWRS